ncbi:MAG: response regulator [Phaeovulum sp.]|uniref:response regulator transcription factor n=1 Tax=Phaeovulum sp. TaxID=2934796 RepID=UPI00272F355D|nr:response regulator [Phaeovulum sp.]MDP2064204.1 response regulator [Phaeovulum sp.]MDP3861996.1 response regulator [Phaeovulum sp.]
MHGKHVVLIEDEPNIAEAIRFILARVGARVTHLATGADAVAVLAAEPPDVLVLDLMLPDRSGLDILADLRAEPALAALPVLMLTARGQSRDREAAERAGANAFLAKPFANSDLLSAVRALTMGGA